MAPNSGTPLAAANENAPGGVASRTDQDLTKRGTRITFATANSHCIDTKHNFFQFKLQQHTMIKSTFQEVLARGNLEGANAHVPSRSHHFFLIGPAMASCLRHCPPIVSSILRVLVSFHYPIWDRPNIMIVHLSTSVLT